MRRFLASFVLLILCTAAAGLLALSPSSTLAQVMDVTEHVPEELVELVELIAAPNPTAPTTRPTETDAPETTEVPETTQVPETTETAEVPETTEATEVPETTEATEPVEVGPKAFTLTFVGNCTLGASTKNYNYQQGFIHTVGEDYTYNFKNVATYFAHDDFTMLNLESVLTDSSKSSGKEYAYRGPTAYVNILSQNSVEAVSLSNNHTMDFLADGYNTTTKTLTDAGVSYVEQDKTLIFTTERGLTIGIYAVNIDNLNEEEIVAAISALEANEEVDLVIFAAHWGNDNTYTANATQKQLAYAAIDAGADIVYGSHPYVLQPIEEYNGGIIYYSLGNFAFGGNNNPKDHNTALVQQEVILEADGTVKLGKLTVVPCSMSSVTNLNNFQPTPNEVGSDAYRNVLAKLNVTGMDVSPSMG